MPEVETDTDVNGDERLPVGEGLMTSGLPTLVVTAVDLAEVIGIEKA